MRYTFTCPHDGEYEVSKETFESFLPKKLRWKLHSKLRHDDTIVGAVLKFPEFCPECRPGGEAHPTLSIIREKKGQIH